mmetsp:Transcript_15724/g.30789  ORF Transcript_15724/g.30789 Transcript_15724/m.30789 type:complete len:205 (+) Transcript_15724:241-855(+)
MHHCRWSPSHGSTKERVHSTVCTNPAHHHRVVISAHSSHRPHPTVHTISCIGIHHHAVVVFACASHVVSARVSVTHHHVIARIVHSNTIIVCIHHHHIIIPHRHSRVAHPNHSVHTRIHTYSIHPVHVLLHLVLLWVGHIKHGHNIITSHFLLLNFLRLLLLPSACTCHLLLPRLLNSLPKICAARAVHGHVGKHIQHRFVTRP